MGTMIVVAGTAAAEPPLAVPQGLRLSLPSRYAIHPAAGEQAATPAAPAMRPGEFALYWSRIRSAMTGCDDAVAAARHALASDPDLAGPAFRKVQSRCSAAAVDVGLVEPPRTARGLALNLLQEGRDACQRSMVEKQVGMEAIEQLLAGDTTRDLRETSLRADAIDRSSLSCRATFAAAGKAARAPMAEYELLF